MLSISLKCFAQGDFYNDNRSQYEIISFDSLVEIYAPNIQTAICIEKRAIPSYANKTVQDYFHCQYQPDAYVLWKPVMQDRFLEKFIKPRIDDSTIIDELDKNFYPNRYPIIDADSLVYNNPMQYYNNLKYKDVNCSTFIVIKTSYRKYIDFFYSNFDIDPPLLRPVLDSLADNRCLKVLYPIFE